MRSAPPEFPTRAIRLLPLPYPSPHALHNPIRTQVTRHLTPNSRRIVLGSSQCRSPESSVHGGNFFHDRGNSHRGT